MLGGMIWKYICIALFIACIGLGITVWFQNGKIDRLVSTVERQKITIETQENTIKKKDEDIANLKDLQKENAKALTEAQKRTGQILAMAGQFKASVPITTLTPRPLGVVTLQDSAKVVNWINQEILK